MRATVRKKLLASTFRLMEEWRRFKLMAERSEISARYLDALISHLRLLQDRIGSIIDREVYKWAGLPG